jgi:NAD(P)-dependent dehydrogenase (short-subunit alcohol dehydrogenase family)
VALVTGSASGIGRATAMLLGHAGADVTCADIDGEGAETTARSIVAARGRARSARVDVSRPAQVEELVATAAEPTGRLDVLCNVAGVMHDGATLSVTEADFDRVMAVNFKGMLFACQAAARIMTVQRSGSIVNMSSAIVDRPAANTLCYAVSKSAILTLTRTLAIEVAGSGVRVNAVSPGFIHTGITERHFVHPDGSIDEHVRDETVARMAALAPLGRMGESLDVAYSALFLASEASSFMTGQVLKPNGGYAIH